MRKSLLLFGLCLATLMISCKKENTEAVLSADMADFARTGQKAIIDAERYSCFVVGEKMRVNNETGTVTSLTNGGRGCNIGSVTQKQSGMYYSFYPADMIPANSDLSNGFANLTVTIPQVQIYDKDENGNQIINNPMAAELDAASGKVLHYRNLCALLKVTVNTTGTLDSIRVFCKGANLWGTGKVNTTDWKLDINANSSADSCYAYLYFPGGHKCNGQGEVFYLVVPQTLVKADANKFSIEVDMIHNGGHKPYQIRLTNDKTLKFGSIYSLGSYTFELVPFESGLFSVSSSTNVPKVRFSPGNLQFSPTGGGYVTTTHTTSTGPERGTWRFAPRQYEYIGQGNAALENYRLNSTNAWVYGGWIDFFGWGTSGYQGTSPMCIDSCYSSSQSFVSGDSKYDWGGHNAIYNPATGKTDAPGTWRTMDGDQWEYLINTRGSNLNWWRYNIVRLTGYPDNTKTLIGLVLYPDGWLADSLGGNMTPNSSTVYNITMAQFEILESKGCAFLPAAGRMTHSGGTGGANPNVQKPYVVSDVCSVGYYWTNHNADNAHKLYFFANVNNGTVATDKDFPQNGFSVRLVKNVK